MICTLRGAFLAPIVLQSNGFDKSNFLDSNNATLAEKCNAYLAVKITSTDQNKQDIYQEYQKNMMITNVILQKKNLRIGGLCLHIIYYCSSSPT